LAHLEISLRFPGALSARSRSLRRFVAIGGSDLSEGPPVNHVISVNSLVTGTCFVLGLAALVFAGLGVIPLRFASLGVAGCFLGNLCYFRRSLQQMEAREAQAFEIGRDSVRSIR
jgi:hypothetical protein